MKDERVPAAFLIQEVISNAEEIQSRLERFSITHDLFAASTLYQDMLTMPLLRICELVSEYKAVFVALDNSYPWDDVAKMRSKMAHPYGGFDFEFVWFAIRDDLPSLVDICRKVIG